MIGRPEGRRAPPLAPPSPAGPSPLPSSVRSHRGWRKRQKNGCFHSRSQSVEKPVGKQRNLLRIDGATHRNGPGGVSPGRFSPFPRFFNRPNLCGEITGALLRYPAAFCKRDAETALYPNEILDRRLEKPPLALPGPRLPARNPLHRSSEQSGAAPALGHPPLFASAEPGTKRRSRPLNGAAMALPRRGSAKRLLGTKGFVLPDAACEENCRAGAGSHIGPRFLRNAGNSARTGASPALRKQATLKPPARSGFSHNGSGFRSRSR